MCPPEICVGPSWYWENTKSPSAWLVDVHLLKNPNFIEKCLVDVLAEPGFLILNNFVVALSPGYSGPSMWIG